MRILLIGGSKSGKSTMGQRLTRTFAAGAPMYYWATMEPTDEEDLARIARHLKDREGWGFETIERGRDLLPALARLIIEASRYSQIWLTSHSAELAELIAAGAPCQRYALENRGGETRIVE